MPTRSKTNYYIKNKVKLMKDFSKYISSIRRLLAEKFEDAKLDKIIEQMTEEFESLIPKIPYIGGDKNFFLTSVMIQDISNLAIFWTLEKEGFSYREIGEFFYKLIDGDLRLEKEHLEKNGIDPAQKPFELINQMKPMIELTQKRTFPFDWVIDYVEGDGISFDYGLDFSECGVYKIYKELGAEKYLPLRCMIAMRESTIFGYGIFRTQTLPNGAPSCDYRWVKKLKAPQKITEQEVSFLKERKICLVCKGKIEGFNNYICPKCEVLYCENCARTLSDLENTCWVCESPLDESKPSKPYKRKEVEISGKKDSQKK